MCLEIVKQLSGYSPYFDNGGFKFVIYAVYQLLHHSCLRCYDEITINNISVLSWEGHYISNKYLFGF